jgi:3-hydroxybutyryl-CoA dehydrogenase
MKKIFLIGDSEKLISELSELLKDKCDICDELDDKVDIVFELTNYDEEMKFKILNFIESKNSDCAIVSSSLCITALRQAAELSDPSKLIGIAFYPGFASMKGIEIAPTRFTDKKIIETIKSLFAEADKETFVSPDRPGMIAMRIISMIINEAYLVLQEGTSNKEDIDTAMKLGTNYPYGPIEWSEKLGVELVYNVLESMQNEFGEDRYRITPLLREACIEERIKI